MEDANLTNIKNNPVIQHAATLAFLAEKSKRMENERDFFSDAYKATHNKYMEMLVENYRLIKKCKGYIKKLRRQLLIHRKNHKYWLNKNQQSQRRIKRLEEWKAKGFKQLKDKLKGCGLNGEVRHAKD